MSLAPGTRLGAYEIVSLAGRGGMGEVYRATDTKLGRHVALKLLPDSFTHDPDRVARFRREAQILAALNHPHIGAIYGLDEAGGQQFDDGKEAIVWIYETAGTAVMRRLTFGGQNRFPIWSPDGQRIAFQSDREGDAGIFAQRADGTGPGRAPDDGREGRSPHP